MSHFFHILVVLEKYFPAVEEQARGTGTYAYTNVPLEFNLEFKVYAFLD